MRVVCVIAARNEEKWLGRTLNSLLSQTHPLSHIIVIDDGSTDDTWNIAREYGCHIVSLPPHGESYIGNLELAKVWNSGLKLAKRLHPDYIFISGADHVYPADYIERLLAVMSSRIVVASGVIAEHPLTHIPRGSGRMVDATYWRRISNLQYPVIKGWESYITSKTRELKLRYRVVADLISHSRPLSRVAYKTFSNGQGMRALGYYPIRAAMRSIKYFTINPKAGLAMIRGYTSYRGPFHDCAYHTWHTHRKSIMKNMLFGYIVKSMFIVRVRSRVNRWQAR